ncbi:formyltetrahydrofolate deformylase [Ferrimonas lipolytica]|uniref:Formyltetrahydrofolate deformylase n=1 Tax=Ferrimonas lipolytica TaxID=2724191 RepID=A0A6H1UFR8_9GAMM|nr:formyltetrahydrofolate deformylase [Ferrimonas lipolytica]QIZ77469.1 formyltetrahydrofolate deformylase [Ferrimonas lipolytica]
MNSKWVLLVDTVDKIGLIHQITGVLHRHNINIDKNTEYVDKAQNLFFMRSEIEGDIEQQQLLDELHQIIPSAHVQLKPMAKKNIVVLVTKEAHAIGDILIKHQFDALNANILAVVGNRDNLQGLVEKFDIPFHYVSHEGLSREEHETAVQATIDQYQPDYLILAKYMRILTPQFVESYPSQIINIHHSFLPAFIGANPYKQAFERGVKIIGATAHFVNNNLDEGPIICQNVIPVDHSDSWQQMASKGRDVERTVLANALRLVLDDQVFVSGNKTVLL